MRESEGDRQTQRAYGVWGDVCWVHQCVTLLVACMSVFFVCTYGRGNSACTMVVGNPLTFQSTLN